MFFTARGESWPKPGPYVRCPEGEIVLNEKELRSLLSKAQQGNELRSAVFGELAGSFTAANAENFLLEHAVQNGEVYLREWCLVHCVTLSQAWSAYLAGPDFETEREFCGARQSEVGHTRAYGICERAIVQFLQPYLKKKHP